MYSYTGTAYIQGFEYIISKTKTQGYGGVWIYSDVFNPNKIYTPEGYIDNLSTSGTSIVSNGVRYNYYRKDHLGNIREVWNGVRKNYSNQVKELASTRQRTQYYPSGLPWAESFGAAVQKHKYNDKEFVEMHGYDTYDIVWRQYYPAIGRFQTPDPEIEQAYNESPYAMCDNNMVNRTDPDGRFWTNVVGAVVSAGIDYAGQVAGNLATGASIGSALTQNISTGSIIVSAVQGAVNPIGGISKAATKAVAQSAVKTVIKTTLKEAAVSATGQVIDNVIKGKDLSNNVVTEAVTGGILGNIKTNHNNAKANQTIKELNTKLDKGKNLTKRQTERMVDAKATKVSNDVLNSLNNFSSTTGQKATTNIIQRKDEKKN